jgi:hypothetical protein
MVRLGRHCVGFRGGSARGDSTRGEASCAVVASGPRGQGRESGAYMDHKNVVGYGMTFNY